MVSSCRLCMFSSKLNENASFQFLLVFLNKVVDEPANKMSAENVAMVMAPNLFLASSPPTNYGKPETMERELRLAAATSKVMLLILTNYATLCEVRKSIRSILASYIILWAIACPLPISESRVTLVEAPYSNCLLILRNGLTFCQ